MLGVHPANPEFMRSVDLLPPVLRRWMVMIPSLLRHFVASCLVTFNAKYLGVHSTSSELTRSPISDTCPLLMPTASRHIAPHETKVSLSILQHLSLRDVRISLRMSSTTDDSDLIASSDLVAPAAQLLGLQLMSPRDTSPHVDPTTPATLIDGSASSELQPLRISFAVTSLHLCTI
jgi:hypothetical protein